MGSGEEWRYGMEIWNGDIGTWYLINQKVRPRNGCPPLAVKHGRPRQLVEVMAETHSNQRQVSNTLRTQSGGIKSREIQSRGKLKWDTVTWDTVKWDTVMSSNSFGIHPSPQAHLGSSRTRQTGCSLAVTEVVGIC